MIKPKRLQKGDNIAIIAPSGYLRKIKIEDIKKSITDRGYNVYIYPSCNSMYRGYLSGNDELRASDLQSAFENKHIDAVFCIRGGYGCARILDLIDFNVIKNNPKIFLGLSDITALHIAFNQICNLVTYHGPLAKSFIDMDEYTEDSLFENISTDENIVFENPPEEQITTLYEGECIGQVVGGNLSVINTLLGTKYEIDTKGKIIFIEDVNEYIYNLDRMINHLDMAGKFKDCSGIIFGDFEGCKKSQKEDWSEREVMEYIARKYKKPAIYNLQSGHCKSVGTIPLGSVCYINTKSKIVKFDYYNC